MGPARFLFLGTGTSAGVPAVGCECAVCTSADPRDQRWRTSAAVFTIDADGHERMILIDASPDLRAQSLRHRLRRCDAILFTHNHVDHTFGLDEVRRFNAVQRRAIDIYAERHTLDHLARVFRHIFERENNVNDTFVADLNVNELAPDRAFDLHGVRVTPLRVEHGNLPILGFRFDAPGSARGHAASPFPLAYLTDVSSIPEPTRGALTGLRTLVLDALRHRPHPTHLTLAEAVSTAGRIGAAETYFVHMAHDLKHAETQATLPRGMFLAYDGLALGG